ncbi:unnamed protein product [Camellia sinensis]
MRCNKNLDYTLNVETVLDVHKNLSSYGLQVLVYNGDHDLTIPNTGTQDWIKLLNLTIVSDWRPWLVDGEVGGEQGTHLKSTSVENVMRCTKGGSITILSSCFFKPINVFVRCPRTYYNTILLVDFCDSKLYSNFLPSNGSLS